MKALNWEVAPDAAVIESIVLALDKALADLSSDVRECITIATNELLINSVTEMNALESRAPIQLTLQWDDFGVLVHVTDFGRGVPQTQIENTAMPCVTDTCGRGLAMVHLLVDDFKCQSNPSGSKTYIISKHL